MINTTHIDGDYLYGFRSFCPAAVAAATNKRPCVGTALHSNTSEELANLVSAAKKRYNYYIPTSTVAKEEDPMRKASFVLTTELRAPLPAARKKSAAPVLEEKEESKRPPLFEKMIMEEVRENLKTIVCCGIDASEVLSRNQYPTRASAAKWEYEELIVWLCRTIRAPNTELACDLPLVAILYVHRFGTNANFEFLCEFQDQLSATETRKFWVPYLALTHTKKYYVKLVTEYKFDINYEINHHFETVCGNENNCTESQIQAKIDAYMKDVIPNICKYKSFTRSEYLVKQIKQTSPSKRKVFSAQTLLPNGKFATPKRAGAGLCIDGARINQTSVYDKTPGNSAVTVVKSISSSVKETAAFIAKGISMVNDDVLQGDFKVVVVSDAGALGMDPGVIPQGGGAYTAVRQAFARAVARFKSPGDICAKGIRVEPLKDFPLYSKPNAAPALSQLAQHSATSASFKDACALVREELAKVSGAYVKTFGELVEEKRLSSTPLQRILNILTNANVLAAHYSLSMLSESKYAAQESAETAFACAFMSPPLSTDPLGSIVNLTHVSTRSLKKVCCVKNLNLYSPMALAQQYYCFSAADAPAAFVCKECGKDSFLPNVSFLDLDVPCQTVVNIQVQIAEADLVLVLGTSDLQTNSEISSVFCTSEENAICINSPADMEALASALERSRPSASERNISLQ